MSGRDERVDGHDDGHDDGHGARGRGALSRRMQALAPVASGAGSLRIRNPLAMRQRSDEDSPNGQERPAPKALPVPTRIESPIREQPTSPPHWGTQAFRRAKLSVRVLALSLPVIAPKAPSRRYRGRGDAEFHPRTLALEEAPRSPIEPAVIAAIFALLATTLIWAFVSRISNYAQAQGKVQTLGRTKVVEALATGKVIAIRVHDGDSVKKGDELVALDPTDAQATRTIVATKLVDLKAETQRELVEINAAHVAKVDAGSKIDWAKDIPAAARRRENAVIRADLAKLAAQIATLEARKAAKEAERNKFSSNIEAQKKLVAVTQENLTMIENLTARGYNSQAKFLDTKALLDGQKVQQTSYEGSLEAARQAILLVDSEIAKTREVFVAARTQAVSDNAKVIVDLEQQLVRADKTLADMTLRAPVGGIVHAAAVTTLGQVVKPGQQLMQVVPSDQPLEIEAYVSNADIGFIRKGDAAIIKVDAFIYNVYGSIDGTVTDVANDASALQGKQTMQTDSLDGAASQTTAAQKTGNLQYPIHLRAARSTMLVEGKEVPLVPGMLVSVEIETERLRAIDYVLSPIEELFSTAGHER